MGKLGAADQALLARVREQYQARTTVPCTKCGYCTPCPNNMNIPVNFELFNYAKAYDDPGAAKFGTTSCSRRGSAPAPASIATPAKAFARSTSQSPNGCQRWRSCWREGAAGRADPTAMAASQPRIEQGVTPRLSSSLRKVFNDGMRLFARVHHAEQLMASIGIGAGAPSKPKTFCGAQQALPRRARSVCIVFSSSRIASVSRRIFAAPMCEGTTIL